MKRYPFFLTVAAVFWILFSLLKIPAAALEAKNVSEEELSFQEDLEDGKYTVMVYLWNATKDTESMGDAALNHEALLTVRDGVYQMEITTHPMTVGTIMACLESMQIRQADGTYQEAEITTRNNEGKKPSAFLFVLPSREEYIDVLIDPKVDIMAGQAIEARLKIDWITLTKAADDAVVKEDTANIVVSTPQPVQKEESSADETKKPSSSPEKVSPEAEKSSKTDSSQVTAASVTEQSGELLLENIEAEEKEETPEENTEIEQVKETELLPEREIQEQTTGNTAEEEKTDSLDEWSNRRVSSRKSSVALVVLASSVILSGFLGMVTLIVIYCDLQRDRKSDAG